MINRRKLANQALQYLYDQRDTYGKTYFWTVQEIAAFCGETKEEPLPEAKHQLLRSVLLTLYHAGAVHRRLIGVKKAKWRMLSKTWDRADPFKRQEPTLPNAVSNPDTVPKYLPQASVSVANEAWIKAVKAIEDLKKEKEQLTKDLNDALDEVKKLKEKELEDVGPRIILVKRWDGTKLKLKDEVLPKVFDRIKQLAECRRPILLVGPSGSGKSFIAKKLAEVLGLDFSSLSCTAGMSESHLLGRSVPDLTHGRNRFQGTDFLRTYEEGGVALLDELDAADGNLLLAVNSGLANRYMNVPNRPDSPKADQHADFVCVATANTFGRGATRQYSGRNQLDEATLDRFRIGLVAVDYDRMVEKTLCPDDGKEFVNHSTNGNSRVSTTVSKLIALGYGWRGTCQYIRHRIEQSGMRRVMSSRFIQDAWIMKEGAGWDLKTVLETFLEGWADEEQAKLVQ